MTQEGWRDNSLEKSNLLFAQTQSKILVVVKEEEILCKDRM